jgi:hypothetical protein
MAEHHEAQNLILSFKIQLKPVSKANWENVKTYHFFASREIYYNTNLYIHACLSVLLSIYNNFVIRNPLIEFFQKIMKLLL